MAETVRKEPVGTKAELTSETVKAMKPPTDRPFTIVWDTKVAGFGVRITSGGTKAFLVDYRAKGVQRRLTIGKFPAWSVKVARAEAVKVKSAAELGEDAMAERHEERTAETLADLFNAYDREHLPRLAPRAAADIRSMWRTYVLPEIGAKTRVKDIGPRDCDRLHATITAAGKTTRANRVVESLRKALNMAVRWGWRADNPASGVHRNHEERRERYLSDDESRRLFAALDGWHEKRSADAIRLLALTGAREGEVLGATWDQIDLETGIWVKPAATVKQRKLHRAPLNTDAVAVLKRMRADAPADAVYLFPGPGGKGHQVDLKRSWLGICKAARMVEMGESVSRKTGKAIVGKDGKPKLSLKPTARIHDLRHSFASVLVSNGASLPVIGALLGHTQSQTTMRYAHLFDDPLRQAAELAGKRLAKKTE